MLDIVIVNWNSGVLLRRCCEAIRRSRIDLSLVNVIIVDNGSTDASLEEAISVLDGALSFHAIKLADNEGFARACNLGAKAGTRQYLLFLNPDTEVERDTLQKSLDKIQKSPVNTVLGARHTDEAGNTVPSCSRFPAPGDFLTDAFGLTRILPNYFKRPTIIGLAGMDYERSGYVDEVSGAFFLLARSDFDYHDGFDDEFFVYYEELDLSLRIQQAGGRIYYDTDLVIQHVGGGVSSQVRDKRLFFELRSRLLYAKKHFRLSGTALVWLVSLLIEPASRIVLLVGAQRFSELPALMRAFLMLYSFCFKNIFQTNWRR